MEKWYNLYIYERDKLNQIQNGVSYVNMKEFCILVGTYQGYSAICSVCNVEKSLCTEHQMPQCAIDLLEEYDIMNLTYDDFIQLHFQLSLIKEYE